MPWWVLLAWWLIEVAFNLRWMFRGPIHESWKRAPGWERWLFLTLGVYLCVMLGPLGHLRRHERE